MNKEIWIEIREHLKEDLRRDPTEKEITAAYSQLMDEVYEVARDDKH